MAFNPFFFSDSPLPMELIYKALEDLKYLNPTVADLKKKVDELTENLDEYVKEQVTEIINQMYEDGTLEEILKESISEFFDRIEKYPVKSNKLDFRRVWRECYRVGTNDRLSRKGLRPSVIQSGTVFKYNEHTYFAVGIEGGADYSNTGDASTQNYNEPTAGVLQIWDYDDEHSFSVAGQICFNAGHFECMDYNEKDGYFYIGSASFGDNIHSDRITRIHIQNVLGQNADVTDFCFLPFVDDEDTRIEKMYLDIQTHYPYNEWQWLGSVSCGAGEPDKFYAGQGARLWLYEWNNSTPLELITSESLIEEIELGIVQKNNIIGINVMAYANMSVTKDFIYYSFTRPNCIIRANRETQKVDWIYMIPRLLNDEMFVGGETEGLKVFDNGDVYYFTYTNIQTAGGLGALNTPQIRMAQMFYQNLFNNVGIASAPYSYYGQTYNIYVDSSIVTYNPRGTQTNPFNNIVEAVFWISTQTRYNNFRVKLRNQSNPYFVYLSNVASVMFESDIEQMCSIGGLLCRGASGNISFHDCYFWYSLQETTGYFYSEETDEYYGAYCAIYDSNVSFINCAYQYNASADNVTIANYIRESNVKMAGVSSKTPPSNPVYWNQSEWETSSHDWLKFINGNYSMILSGGKNSTGTWIFN